MVHPLHMKKKNDGLGNCTRPIANFVRTMQVHIDVKNVVSLPLCKCLVRSNTSSNKIYEN